MKADPSVAVEGITPSGTTTDWLSGTMGVAPSTVEAVPFGDGAAKAMSGAVKNNRSKSNGKKLRNL